MSHPYTKSCADFFIILCRMIVSLTIEGSDQLVILSPCCCGNNNKGRTINKTEIFRTQTAGYLKSSTCNLTLKHWRCGGILCSVCPVPLLIENMMMKLSTKADSYSSAGTEAGICN